MGAIKFVLLLCVWLFVGAASTKLSNQVDLELENQLKRLNKPAITTIRTRYGEEYDCVDFYNQRAFDHPSLKNNNFLPEMRPNLHPTQIFDKHSSTTHLSFNDIWSNGKGCPSGSVPIKRVTKDDLIRIRLAEKIYGQAYKPTTPGEQGTHYAVVHTTSGTEFYGAGTYLSVHNPPVNGSQYSSSRVKISNGIESIEAGWTVNPSLYNDAQTRLFIHTNTGIVHCFNTYCPGFVSVNTHHPLGMPLTQVTRPGGPTYVITILIYKDAGKWWLQVGDDNVTVGFWPEAIFTSLKDFASHGEWGGKAYSPPNVPSPPMGAGNMQLRYNTKYDASCGAITVIDKSHKTMIARKTSRYADIKQYQVEDLGLFGNDGHVIVFGGRGGYIGN